MLKNYLTIALRNLVRRKLLSLINLTGLAFGIAFMLLIGLFLYFELSYNQSFRNFDHIYRLIDAAENGYAIDYRVRDAMVEKIPGVKNASLMNKYPVEVNYNDQVFQFENMLIVDVSFLEIFDFTFRNGNPATAFRTAEGVVLTEATALKIFGSMDVLGKQLIVDHEYEMTVTGVVQDLPPNTSFRADLLVSVENTRQKRLPFSMSCQEYDGIDDSKCKYPFNIFVELNPNADAAAIAQQIPSLFDPDDYRFPDEVRLTSFKTNYFDTQYNDRDLAHGNAGLVRTLALIGLVILTLAVINYANLTTAGYKYRLTEIGVKKCLGVQRRALITQFLVESLLFCLCAVLLGVALAEIFLPYFNQYVEKPLQIRFFDDVQFSLLFMAFIFLLSIIAGFFPALLLSKISPLALFRSNPFIKGTASHYRSVLSVFQFSTAIVLICFLLVMSRQIDYAKHKDPGFEAGQLLYLNIHHKMRDRLPALTDRLRQYHGLESLSITNGIPGKINVNLNGFDTIVIDADAIKTFGFQLVRGREPLPGDLNKVCLINSMALSKFENGDFRGQEINGSKIIGVVSDFHFAPMYKKIAPLVLMYSDWGGHQITLRTFGPAAETVSFIREAWAEICPDFPLDLQFYNDAFAAMYRQEENLARLISIFASVAVVISCMGIFGLAVFQSQQRVKEIGIRKILGATVTEITAMLTGNFTRWVLIANLVAWPVAYFIASKWLENFAYRIELQWWMFALAGGLALMIALLAVSAQAIKAALANPVDALRCE